jgi:hypothetical protein
LTHARALRQMDLAGGRQDETNPGIKPAVH